MSIILSTIKFLSIKLKSKLCESALFITLICASCVSNQEKPIPNYHILTGDVTYCLYDAIGAMAYANRPIKATDLGIKGDVSTVKYTDRLGSVYLYSFDTKSGNLKSFDKIYHIYTGARMNTTTVFLYDNDNKPAMARTYQDGRLLRIVEFSQDENYKRQLHIETRNIIHDKLNPDIYYIEQNKDITGIFSSNQVKDFVNSGLEQWSFSPNKDTVLLEWTGDIMKPESNGLLYFNGKGIWNKGNITKSGGSIISLFGMNRTVNYQAQFEYDEKSRIIYHGFKFSGKDKYKLFSEDSICVRYEYKNEDEHGNWTVCTSDHPKHPLCPITREISYKNNWQEKENPFLKNDIVTLYNYVERRKVVIDYYTFQDKGYVLYSGWANDDQYYTYIIPAGEADFELADFFKSKVINYQYSSILPKVGIPYRERLFALNLKDRCPEIPIIVVVECISGIDPIISVNLTNESYNSCDLHLELIQNKQFDIHLPIFKLK